VEDGKGVGRQRRAGTGQQGKQLGGAHPCCFAQYINHPGQGADTLCLCAQNQNQSQCGMRSAGDEPRDPACNAFGLDPA
jgi:hypothetical protein